MKPISKAQLLTDRETLTRENCVLASALNYLARDEFKHIGKAFHHTVKLAGPTDAHGGIVLLTFAPPGQSPYTTAQYFDDWFSYWRDYIPSHTNDEAIAIRELAFKTKEAVYNAQTEWQEHFLATVCRLYEEDQCITNHGEPSGQCVACGIPA